MKNNQLNLVSHLKSMGKLFCLICLISGCSKDDDKIDISKQFEGDYIFNSSTYRWDLNNGGRYENGPKDCIGTISSKGINILNVECCNGNFIFGHEADGGLIYETC